MPDDYEGLDRYLESRIAALRNPAILDDLAQALARYLQVQHPPMDRSYALRHAVSVIGPVESSPEGMAIGVGDQRLLGNPDQRTEGTLRAFYDAHPEVPRKSAWKYLPRWAKELLRDEREAGFFGGPSYRVGGPARYYYVQSGEGSWSDSAAAANIRPTYFTTHALEDWRAGLHLRIKRSLGY